MSINVSSLMRFRFQKQGTLPVKSESQSSIESNGIIDSSTITSDESVRLNNNAEQSNGEGDVGNVPRKKRGVLVVVSDSDDESSNSAKTASPMWLSKDVGKKLHQNGHATDGKKAVIPESPDLFCSQDSSEKFFSDLSMLKETFPDKPDSILTEAIEETSDVDQAINYIIDLNNGDLRRIQKRKRVHQLSDGSSDGGPVSHKRIKALSSDSLDEETDEKMTFLAEAFPDFSSQVLLKALSDSDFSLEQASQALGSVDAPAVSVISPTKNLGSIKAYQAARQKAKARKVVRVESDSDDDDDDVVSDSDGDYGTSRRKRRPSFTQEYSPIVVDSEEVESFPVIEFLNDASLEELSSVPGCSRKKAKCLLEMRPFDDWDHLTEKFKLGRVSLTLIEGCRDLLQIRAVIGRLMEKCTHIAAQLEHISGDPNMRDENYKQQPSILNSSMKLSPYQLVGLNWLILMHRQQLNGILADEMGLGKTIQTIAFLAQLFEDGDRGPHVIIAPSSTVDNWLRELQLWCDELKVMLYYGTQDVRAELRQELLNPDHGYNVIVSTYNMATGCTDDRMLFKKMKFHYSIFDEGHMLKNMASLRYKTLMRINARRRLLLTGTPLQNNLLELMSLLCFLMPDLFATRTDQLKRMFVSMTGRSGSQSSYETRTIEHAKSVLKPFFLRRLKSEVLSQLPDKTAHTEFVPMAFEQQDLYDSLRRTFSETVSQCNPALTSSTNMVMQLRKAANHHLLHRTVFDDERLRHMAALFVQEPTHCDANVDYVYEDMAVMSDFELHKLCLKYRSLDMFKLDDEQIADSGKFRRLDELLAVMKERGDRVLLFSQFTMMLDVIEDYMTHRQHKYMRLDGQTAVDDRQEYIDRFNREKDVFVFLLSTRAGGLGINLTAANVVILHDIDFNPYNDKQAEDRCHRVGQMRPVSVYRLISKNTIEEGMLRCAEAKLQLEQEVTRSKVEKPSDADKTNVGSLLIESLQDLKPS